MMVIKMASSTGHWIDDASLVSDGLLEHLDISDIFLYYIIIDWRKVFHKAFELCFMV
jgi:hypothetical protein